MKDALVIGFGNSLRGDDGAGIAAALRFAQACPWADTLACHQLGPELAETIAAYKTVVFVDASMTATEPFLEALLPVDSEPTGDMHAYGPQGLINLSKELYGSAWKSILVLHIPACSIEFGDCRSKETERGIAQGVEMLRNKLIGALELPQN